MSSALRPRSPPAGWRGLTLGSTRTQAESRTALKPNHARCDRPLSERSERFGGGGRASARPVGASMNGEGARGALRQGGRGFANVTVVRRALRACPEATARFRQISAKSRGGISQSHPGFFAAGLWERTSSHAPGVTCRAPAAFTAAAGGGTPSSRRCTIRSRADSRDRSRPGGRGSRRGKRRARLARRARLGSSPPS